MPTQEMRNTLVTLGARNVALEERAEHDYYATEPKAADLLLEKETFSKTIWECACGEGHLAKRFAERGYDVIATDIVDRGYGGVLDFLSTDRNVTPDADIITNPPFDEAQKFTEHALDIVDDGRKVAMFLKMQFLESQERRKLFDRYPPELFMFPQSGCTVQKTAISRGIGKDQVLCVSRGTCGLKVGAATQR